MKVQFYHFTVLFHCFNLKYEFPYFIKVECERNGITLSTIFTVP